MNNKDVLTALIKEISGQSRVLSIPRLYIDLTGSLETALFLSQAIYWSDKGKSGDGWFYKTYEQWAEELSLTEYQVRKAVKLLSGWDVISTKLKKAINGSPTVHYKVHIDVFEAILRAHFDRTCEAKPITYCYEEQKFRRGERGNYDDPGAVVGHDSR